MTTSHAQLRAKVNRRVRFLDLCVDQSLAVEHDRLSAELQAAERTPQQTLADGASRRLAEQLADLESTMAGQQDRFWLQALPQRKFLALLDDHEPREGNARDLTHGFNWSTFPQAVIAAASIDPPEGEVGVEKLDEAFAEELFCDLLSAADAEALLDAAMRDNVIPSKIPFSALASAALRAPEQS